MQSHTASEVRDFDIAHAFDEHGARASSPISPTAASDTLHDNAHSREEHKLAIDSLAKWPTKPEELGKTSFLTIISHIAHLILVLTPTVFIGDAH
jgi:hypothetical protein